MAQSFPETAHLKVDPVKYKEGLEAIFGTPPSPWCDGCDKRHAYCECTKHEFTVRKLGGLLCKHCSVMSLPENQNEPCPTFIKP